jgi:hypothetical protein
VAITQLGHPTYYHERKPAGASNHLIRSRIGFALQNMAYPDVGAEVMDKRTWQAECLPHRPL